MEWNHKYLFISERRKMRFLKTNAFIGAALLVMACSLNAQTPNDVNNGSFEQTSANDPNIPLYWEPDGREPEIRSTYTHYYGYDSNGMPNPVATIDAVDGSVFVMLQSGGGTQETSYSQLSQIISVDAGESITGVYFFATDDYLRWNDSAAIYLSSIDPNSITGRFDIEILLAYKDVAAVGDFQAMEGWERFSHTFDSNEAGTYRLILEVEDYGDYILSSYLAVDALRITAGPPEPLCIHRLAGDVNHDCKVDFADFALMTQNWLKDCSTEPLDPACE
jgi:hypothetical protein